VLLQNIDIIADVVGVFALHVFFFIVTAFGWVAGCNQVWCSVGPEMRDEVTAVLASHSVMDAGGFEVVAVTLFECIEEVVVHPADATVVDGFICPVPRVFQILALGRG